jgi:hypothetical protein
MSADVIALPVRPMSDATARADPMLDLARQMEQLTASARPANIASFEAARRADAEILRRLGLSSDDELRTKWRSSEYHDRWWKTFCEVYAELGTTEVIELTYKLDSRRDEVFERMIARPISTLSDAALLFSAAVLVGAIDGELWTEPLRDLDWNEKILRQLIEKIIVAGGGKAPEERSHR